MNRLQKHIINSIIRKMGIVEFLHELASENPIFEHLAHEVYLLNAASEVHESFKKDTLTRVYKNIS